MALEAWPPAFVSRTPGGLECDHGRQLIDATSNLQIWDRH